MTPARHAATRRSRGLCSRPSAVAIGSSLVLHLALIAAATTLFVAESAERRPTVLGSALRTAAPPLAEAPPAPVLDPDLPPRIDDRLLPDTPDVELPDPEFEAYEDSPPVTIELRTTAGRFGADVRLRAARGRAPLTAPQAATHAPEPERPVAACAASPPTSPPPPPAVEPPRAHASNHPPGYPRRAERLGWAGAVRLAIVVDATGAVEEVRVVESSGFAVLDDAAREAALGWRYEPATRGGVPVPFTLHRTIRFQQ